MADMKITEYNSHNAPATGDQFFMIGTSEEYRIDYDALASAILDKLTTKTYSGISNNVIDAIAALNSRTDGIKTDNFSMNTADTYTKTLDLRTIYLVTVGKLNTRNNSYSGMYLVIPHQTASSILTIAESSALSSITIDAGTLSITTNTSYVIASITRLTNMA